MAPLIPQVSPRKDTPSIVSDEDDDYEYSNQNAGLCNMPDEVLDSLADCFERLHDPDNFDHLPIGEQLEKFSQRDLREGRLYQIAKKFFRGSMRPRKRVFVVGYKPHGLRQVDSMMDPGDKPLEVAPQPSRSELNVQEPKPVEVSPRIIEAQQKQAELNEYQRWLAERKKLRHDLDHMGLDVHWLLNKSDRSPLEEKMLQEMLEKMRKPKAAVSEVAKKKRKKTAKRDPFIRRPVPRILYIIDKHLRVNKMRLMDFFQRTDKSKTWDISRPEFRTIFATHNLQVKEEELDEMFVCFDKNLNEFIDYRDLAEAMSILRLEKRQIRRTIASGKSISAEDWDSMFSPSPTTPYRSPTGMPISRPETPNQLEVPDSDYRKEQFILSSDEAMVDLRKRDRAALKNNITLAQSVPAPQEGGEAVGGDVVGGEESPAAFITPKVEKPPFTTGRGPTRSPQWFPPPSRTAGRNTGSNLRENFPDEEISRPHTKLYSDPLLLPDDEDELDPRPLSSRSPTFQKATSPLGSPKPAKTARGSATYSASSKSVGHKSSQGVAYTRGLAKTPSSFRSGSRKSGKIARVSSMIKTGVKAIDDHMRPSQLGGETAAMTDKFRQLKLKEYYEILRICQQNGTVFNEKLFQRVLLHPGDKVPRELKKIRQPANPLMSQHFADPPQRVRTPTIIRQKGKLRQTANGDLMINSRHLYKQGNQCAAEVERVELSTGRAAISRKIDCWMSYEEYCNLTSKYEERYIKVKGHVNTDAFWPGYMLDKMRLHFDEPDGNGIGKHAIFSHTQQRKPMNPGYFHRESWPQNEHGVAMCGDITMNPRR